MCEIVDKKDTSPADLAITPEINAKQVLKADSTALLAKLIAETDTEQIKDLTALFNINQTKKTMLRQDTLNDLQDVLVEQAMTRFSSHPDEISNKELLDGLKTVQDMLERGQKQVSGAPDMPLIQINQQSNDVNIGDVANTTRESREKVKNAVLTLLNGLKLEQTQDAIETAVEITSKTSDVNKKEGD